MKKTVVFLSFILILLLTVSCSFPRADKPTESHAEEPVLSDNTSLASVTADGTKLLSLTEPLHVPFSTESVEIAVELADEKATADITALSLALTLGENNFSVTVTAENGDKKTYSFTVIRDKNTNNALGSVTVNGEALDLNSLTYSVPYETKEITLDATAESDDATLTMPTSPIALQEGDNDIVITVTAQNGDINEAHLTVTRAYYEASHNADLASITMNNATLDTAFKASKTSYTASLKYSTAKKVTVTAKTADEKATVSVSGPSTLSVGDNVFKITVLAEDKSTKKTYTVTVKKPEPWPYAYDGTYGLDITDKKDIVSICYSVWFDFVNTRINFKATSENTISKLEVTGKWSSEAETFYYWGEPALGFYKSTDRSVIRTHMTQLSDAGIDFIILDFTNVPAVYQSYYCTENTGYVSRWDMFLANPATAILEECAAMREEGLKTPNIVFWNRGDSTYGYWTTTKLTYNEFFCNENYKDLWVYWDNKPLFLVTMTGCSMSTATKSLGTLADKVTVRKMWGFENPGTSDWTFLQRDNSVRCSNNEQMCVCVAVQRTYMSVTSTAMGRNHGITFWNQWKNAFAVHPKIVTITWWNEWVAQRQPVTVSGKYGHFVDNYNQEYSRDIEPMKGGHGDRYYQWMKNYIKAYKRHRTCPRYVESGY